MVEWFISKSHVANFTVPSVSDTAPRAENLSIGEDDIHGDTKSKSIKEYNNQVSNRLGEKKE